MKRGFFGIEGLDRALPGGMSYGSQIQVFGETGIGKSVMAASFIQEGLLTGDTCIYISFDTDPQAMREALAGFHTSSQAYEREGRLILVDAYDPDTSGERYVLRGDLSLDKYFAFERSLVASFAGKPMRLVVDSTSPLMVGADARKIMEFQRSRGKFLHKNGVMGMDVYVKDVLEERAVSSLVQLYNLVVRLYFQNTGGRPVRMMQLAKVKSGTFSTSRFMFSIHPRYGILVNADMEV